MFFIAFLLLIVPPVYIITIYNNYVSTITWHEAITSELG